jgi:hypothetical protein
MAINWGDIDWNEMAKLGASVAPTLIANQTASNPYDNPEIQRALEIQRQRLEQSQPAFDAMVSMAYGMTPTRYRGTGGPSFSGSPSMGAPGSAIPRSPAARPMSTSSAPRMASAPSTSGGGSGWKTAGSILSSAAGPLLKLFQPKPKKDAKTPAEAGGIGGVGDYETGPTDPWAMPGPDFSPDQKTPSVSTSETMGPIVIEVVGPDGQMVYAQPLWEGSDRYTDDQGNIYDASGNYLGNLYAPGGYDGDMITRGGG